jgi:hypothetical protein
MLTKIRSKYIAEVFAHGSRYREHRIRTHEKSKAGTERVRDAVRTGL